MSTGNRMGYGGFLFLLLALPAASQNPPAVPGAPGGAPKAPAARARPPMPPPPRLHPNLPASTRAAQLEQYGVALLRTGYAAEAAAAFSQAAEATPSTATLWEQAGWAYLDAGDAPQALAMFARVREAALPGEPPPSGLLVAHFALGEKEKLQALLPAFAAPDELEKARKVVAEGLAEKPFTRRWNFALGYIYARLLNNSPRGISFLEDAAEADPKDPEVWLLLADLQHAAGNQAQGDAAAEHYVELAPETRDYYRLRASRFLDLNQPETAVAEYRAGIKKHPRAWELYQGLARAQDASADDKGAVSTYAEMIRQAREAGQQQSANAAEIQLAALHARRGRFAEAEKLYGAAAARPEAGTALIESWAYSLSLLGRFDQSARAFRRALEREKSVRGESHPLARESIAAAAGKAGLATLAAGQEKEAEPLFRQAISGGLPRSAAAAEYAGFASLLRREKKLSPLLRYHRGDELWAVLLWRQLPEGERAAGAGRFSLHTAGVRALLGAILKRDARAWPAAYAQARMQARDGDVAGAETLLRQVTAAQPAWWAAHFALADRLQQTGDARGAMAALERVIELEPECRPAVQRLAALRSTMPR